MRPAAFRLSFTLFLVLSVGASCRGVARTDGPAAETRTSAAEPPYPAPPCFAETAPPPCPELSRLEAELTRSGRAVLRGPLVRVLPGRDDSGRCERYWTCELASFALERLAEEHIALLPRIPAGRRLLRSEDLWDIFHGTRLAWEFLRRHRVDPAELLPLPLTFESFEGRRPGAGSVIGERYTALQLPDRWPELASGKQAVYRVVAREIGRHLDAALGASGEPFSSAQHWRRAAGWTNPGGRLTLDTHGRRGAASAYAFAGPEEDFATTFAWMVTGGTVFAWNTENPTAAPSPERLAAIEARLRRGAPASE